ncbi:MAG: rhodanese-like domain-containing protein [Gloeomargarita sp. DG02_1_bins_92]
MTQTPTIQNWDAPELWQEWQAGRVVLVDVREGVEFAGERIPGAISRPLSQFDPQQWSVPEGQTVVLYCQSGNRSYQAAQRLWAAGWSTVGHLQGGLMAWRQAGYPVERNPQAPISLFRQVQIVAGGLVLLGTVLGVTLSPWFLLLSGFVGAGMVFAGVTNTCALGMLLAQLPYNRRAGQSWRR